LAQGLREHLPGAVGIVTKGVPICALSGFAHFVLGVSVSDTALATLLAAAGVSAAGFRRGAKRAALPVRSSK
jgi:hypothetical protein